MNEPYDTLNKEWKSLCKVMLGSDIKDLKKYEKYLSKYVELPIKTKSNLTKNDVSLSSTSYSKGSKFVAYDEMSKADKLLEKISLDINTIKDIDSIVNSIYGSIFYCGNIILGNSSYVENSDSCENANYVYNSIRIFDSKFVAYSSDVRYGESIFGCDKSPMAKYQISTYNNHRNNRCMETLRTYISTDCYYTVNLENCNNCMFTFNQRSKSYIIGNIQLTKNDYLKYKKSLVEQIKDELLQKSYAPSIIEIVGGLND